eukprot:SAG31_NODE_30951_length_374_cov_0.756364_1_plen_25_part_10
MSSALHMMELIPINNHARHAYACLT